VAEIASGFVTLIPSFKGGQRAIQKDLDGAAGPAGVSAGKKAGKGFSGSFVGGLGKMGAALGAAFAAPVVIGGLNSLADKASDLNETLNKSQVIFGKQAGAMEKWASSAAKNLGLSKGAALAAASGFGDMFSQIGFSGGEAAKMSKQVVQMSADLGSFSNLDTADVSDRISAAFRGEYDSLQAVIPNINAARVESEALAATGKKTAKDLTAQEKATAVLAIVQKDGARAMGDFAKTSDGAANKAKIQAARWEDLKTKAGGLVLPLKSLALDGFGAIITGAEKLGPKITKLGDFFQPAVDTVKLFIVTVTGEGADVDVPWMNQTIDFASRVQQVFGMAVGYIRANVLPALLGIGSAVRGFVAVALPIVQQFVTGMVARIRPLMPQIMAIFQTIGQIITGVMALVQAVIQRATAVISFIWTRWGSNIMNFVAKVFGSVVTIVGGVLKVIAGIIKTVTSVIRGDWSGAWAGIKQILAGAWQAIRGIISGALTIIKGVLSAAWALIKTGVSRAWDGIRSAVSTGIGKMVSVVKGIPGKITSAVGDLGSLLVHAGAKLIQGLIDGITSRIRALKDKAGEVAQTIKDFFPGSPVKRGPLTSWNNGGAGRRLGGMLADGLTRSQSEVAAASRGLAGSVAVPSSSAAGDGSRMSDEAFLQRLAAILAGITVRGELSMSDLRSGLGRT